MEDGYIFTAPRVGTPRKTLEAKKEGIEIQKCVPSILFPPPPPLSDTNCAEKLRIDTHLG